jgi:hypothetical protein
VNIHLCSFILGQTYGEADQAQVSPPSGPHALLKLISVILLHHIINSLALLIRQLHHHQLQEGPQHELLHALHGGVMQVTTWSNGLPELALHSLDLMVQVSVEVVLDILASFCAWN